VLKKLHVYALALFLAPKMLVKKITLLANKINIVKIKLYFISLLERPQKYNL